MYTHMAMCVILWLLVYDEKRDNQISKQASKRVNNNFLSFIYIFLAQSFFFSSYINRNPIRIWFDY